MLYSGKQKGRKTLKLIKAVSLIMGRIITNNHENDERANKEEGSLYFGI